jgi:hypothetical protein
MPDYPVPEPHLMYGIISIATAAVVLLFHLLFFASRGFNDYLRKKYGESEAPVYRILLQRYLGGVLFGLMPIPIIVFVFRGSMINYGFSGNNLAKSILYWIPLAVLCILLSYRFSRNERYLALYPQIRVSEWSVRLVAASAWSWIIYLVGYEFLLRGFLLFSCLGSFGMWPAILINICLYTLFHLHKGIIEAVGSLFVGFLFCYLAIFLGSFWIALFTHIIMALSNEWITLSRNPDMRIVKNRTGK